jgi:hypothetical protein
MALVPLSKTVLNSTRMEENNQTGDVSDSTQSHDSLTITSENTLENKVPQVPSNQTTYTNNTFSNEDESSTCPLQYLSTISGNTNERGTVSYGFTRNSCMTPQSLALDRNLALFIAQTAEENLYELMYNTETILSDIVSIFSI